MSDIRKWKALVESASKVLENDTEDMAHTDHEVSMAKSQLLSAVKSSTRIAKQLQNKSEEEGLEGWVASKLTMAEDYLQAVADHMDGQEINEGYKVMPPMDPKYVARKGLEGPFTTLSGKVVYYDPKEGKYYDPDTDIYLSYDEFQNYDKDYSGMKDERDEVKEAGGYYTQPVYDMIKKHGYEKVMHELLTALDADVIQSFLQRANFDESVTEADETKYGIVRYPDTAISYIKNDGNGWEHIFDKSYGFKGPVDKADLKYAKKIAKEKIPSRMFGMNEEEDPYYASQTIMDEDPPLGINYDYANLPKVNWDKYSTKAIKKFLSVIENLDFESGYYGDADDFDDMHFNATQWIEKNVLAKRQDKSVKESTEMMTEAQFDEAAGEKDACYRKVKSRYKVWPSAYASGALVKCRKVGASNWGNSKK